MTKLIERHEYDAAELIRKHPPRWTARNKCTVFEIAGAGPFTFEGRIVYSRWAEEGPPDARQGGAFSVRKGFMKPDETPEGTIAWHVNFADPELFFAYASGLFAQDEMQVAEHPILASVREALLADGRVTRTVDNAGQATPVTITGVQRRCMINTSPSAASPRGLYGNEFARAGTEEVRRATRPLTPPTISNILAMAAPSHGRGVYSWRDLERILATAFTGFRAAAEESRRLAGSDVRTRVHTGFWGCGAFGGNREVMTILQSLAADLAGVDLVFWSTDEEGFDIATRARAMYLQILGRSTTTDTFLTELARAGFAWGRSNGT